MADDPIILEECEITIQEDDGNTPPLTAILMEACSAQAVILKPRHQESTYREPGLAYESVHSFIVGWDVDIQGLVALLKTTQISPFKDHTKKWRIYVYNKNPNLAEAQRDRWDFRGGRAVNNTPELRLAESELGRINLSFKAEQEVAA